jgi:hypothetical protein
MHFAKKLYSTIKIISNLALARTFGTYIHSGWDGTIAYARYKWRGKEWIIPTSSVCE